VSYGIAVRDTSRHDEEIPDTDGKQFLMGDHVHVRLSQQLSVSEEGKLVEHSRCGCGATWTRTYEVADGEQERPTWQ
jgi:hypothetical protein